ncbi:hypothetical protein [Shewanella khirikhana]|uniref:Lipoprotein n=1 Tax=Shewanella khirikhana TaxID=1965282 RepID=A0ABN5TQI0_9GAMM|nr:hypothetical protein [Shewanella khirikhana]AZQ09784.1 hypothetical protein STH12_00645 [Shewanella khirikhana]
MASLRPLLLAAALGVALPACQSTEPPKEITLAEANPVMLTLFSLKTLSAFEIAVPDSNAKAPLSKFIEGHGQKFVIGEYVDGPVRGNVALDYTRMQALNAPFNNTQLLLAPFVVSNQGSGSFWYLGLFSFDIPKGTIRQLDASFLGDRIAVQNLNVGSRSLLPVSINAELLVHGPQQSMAEPPRLLEIRRLNVTADGKLMADQ